MDELHALICRRFANLWVRVPWVKTNELGFVPRYEQKGVGAEKGLDHRICRIKLTTPDLDILHIVDSSNERSSEILPPK